MRAFRAMTLVELKLFGREPLTVVFVLVLPVVMLYVLNGVFNSERRDPGVWEGLSAVDFYTPSYVALVAATAGVLSLPVHLCAYREQGVLRRFRASAVRPAVLVAAHLTVTGLLATAGAVLVGVLSVLVYDAPLPRSWAGTAAAYLLVCVTFAALGALIGFLVPTARAAQGLGVLLFFVFMLLGGAGPPRETLPTAMVRISDVCPLTYGARLVRHAWLGQPLDTTALLVMVSLLVVCLALTAWRLGAEDSR